MNDSKRIDYVVVHSVVARPVKVDSDHNTVEAVVDLDGRLVKGQAETAAVEPTAVAN